MFDELRLALADFFLILAQSIAPESEDGARMQALIQRYLTGGDT